MHTDSIAMHSSKCSSSSRLGTSCSRFGRYWLERKKDATAKKGKDTAKEQNFEIWAAVLESRACKPTAGGMSR
jgi:hypothetical protein